MNSLNNRYRQQTVNNNYTDMSVSILDDVAALCRENDQNRAIPANGQAVRDDILAELEAIEAPDTIGFAITCEAPAEVLDALSPEMRAALADFDMPSEESPAVKAARAYAATPQAAALLEANKTRGHIVQAQDEIDAYRKTEEGRLAHNADSRISYAVKIRREEGRDVRNYQHHGNEAEARTAKQKQDKASQKKTRDSWTPEKRKEESAKSSERRRARKAREAETLKQDYIDGSIV